MTKLNIFKNLEDLIEQVKKLEIFLKIRIKLED